MIVKEESGEFVLASHRRGKGFSLKEMAGTVQWVRTSCTDLEWVYRGKKFQDHARYTVERGQPLWHSDGQVLSLSRAMDEARTLIGQFDIRPGDPLVLRATTIVSDEPMFRLTDDERLHRVPNLPDANFYRKGDPGALEWEAWLSKLMPFGGDGSPPGSPLFPLQRAAIVSWQSDWDATQQAEAIGRLNLLLREPAD